MNESTPENDDRPVYADEIPPALSEGSQPCSRRRSWAWLAWLVIAGVVGFIAVGTTLLEKRRSVTEDRLSHLAMKMQARYLLGAEEIFQQRLVLQGSLDSLRKGDVGQRLRFVVLSGEMSGAKDAMAELARLDADMAKHAVKATAKQAKTKEILRRLYGDYERGRFGAPSLTRADREYLHAQLDWFGDLALAPQPEFEDREAVLAPARRTFGIMIGGFAALLLLGFAGFVGAIVLIILACTGYLRGGIQTGTGRGGIYAETFAVWLLLFLGFSLAASRISLGIPYLLQEGLAILLSLTALGWPVLRGVPWRDMRQDVGLTLGRNPVIEPAIGVACYAMAIPLLFVGLLVTFVLMLVQQRLAGGDGNPFAPPSDGTHPIVEPLAEGGTQEWLLVLFLASVVAPLVEETMFRGVLYRHLREASARFGPVLSFLVSAAVVSFIFAAVHPQGLIAVPVLMALALGFTVAREWRGTLIPGMVAHALHNGAYTVIVSLMLSD
jgi:membrane protease YdiL (CAAX protease family)